MINAIGRIFYGIAIALLGILTIYYRDFPYMLIPPKHAWLTDHIGLVYLSGGLLFLAGVCILYGGKLLRVSLLLGTILLLVFCFYFIPYELTSSPNYTHFGDWENAAKELALAGGAFVVSRWGLRFGTIIFALTILSFGIDHFLFAKEAQDYIPAWIPYHLFWMYFCGLALAASAVAMLLNIKVGSAAFLLGSMILIWVLILHIPRMMAAPLAGNEGEVTSGLIALAYSGIAYAIVPTNKQASRSR